MNQEKKLAIAEELRGMLEKAGLPAETKLFGQAIAFTYETDAGDCVRISTAILGINLTAGIGMLRLMTPEIDKRFYSDICPPALVYRSEPGCWAICFYHDDPMNRLEMFYGELELL